jgi:hypothetical protein
VQVADVHQKKPVVFAKFLGKDILDEQGRLLFSLLNAFATSGYSTLLFDSLPAERMGKYGLMAKRLPGVAETTTIPERSGEMYYLFDHEDREAGKRNWSKKIRVRFDIFSRFWLRRPILMPFPVHPVHTGPDFRERLLRYRSNPRNLRVFFSGETAGYTANRITYPRAKLPRLEIVDTIRQLMADRTVFVQEKEMLDRMLTAGFVDRCVILDTSRLRVPDPDWLDVLGRAEFFLAPPGIVMPMCHNAVEALAVGTIPIINYAEWFDPRLEHMRNCVVFDDQQDLIAKINSVFAMDPAAIAAMRRGAIHYYDTYLSSESFTAEIEDRHERKIDVLMILEEYVRKNARRLSGRSVLMRGSAKTSARSRVDGRP